jgi:hypothetical protein
MIQIKYTRNQWGLIYIKFPYGPRRESKPLDASCRRPYRSERRGTGAYPKSDTGVGYVLEPQDSFSCPERSLLRPHQVAAAPGHIAVVSALEAGFYCGMAFRLARATWGLDRLEELDSVNLLPEPVDAIRWNIGIHYDATRSLLGPTTRNLFGSSDR